jgi:D-inositol-3-phosphate glycosyltransferase
MRSPTTKMKSIVRKMPVGKSVGAESLSASVDIGAVSTTSESLTVRVGLLTGGQDRPYAFGLAMALAASGTRLDVVGSDEVDSPEMRQTQNLRFLNIKGDWRGASQVAKAGKLVVYYARLLGYAASTRAPVLHILWNNRLEFFDRTLFMLYLKILGKKVTLTAHNVNAGRRDSNDSLMNRLTLKCQYRLADHIFVHTKKMQDELCSEFGVRENNVTVLRHPINDAFPDTELTPEEAKLKLDLGRQSKVMLCFGRIRPYKGLEYAVSAFERIAAEDPEYRLVIAGESKKGCEEYFREVLDMIDRSAFQDRILVRTEFIPDEDAEIYLKAADVLVLPYKEIFQSGVLFLAYSFGLPVVATDVGSFREEIVEGRTGFVCKPCDVDDLAEVLREYFRSDLFRRLSVRRSEIKSHAFEEHSWKAVAEATGLAYQSLLQEQSR